MAVVLVDRLGRRVLLIASELGMAISIFGLATFFYLDENKMCPSMNATSLLRFDHSDDVGEKWYMPRQTTGISIGLIKACKNV